MEGYNKRRWSHSPTGVGVFTSKQLLKKELSIHHNISEIERTYFIKTRSEKTKAYVVTFNQKNLPYTIYIPGERSDVRVSHAEQPSTCGKNAHY